MMCSVFLRRQFFVQMILLELLILSLLHAPAAAQTLLDPASAVRDAVVRRAEHEREHGRAQNGEDLLKFYSERGFTPAWLANGLPSESSAQALTMIAEAYKEGLDPADYDVVWLSQRLSETRAVYPASDDERVEVDVALTASVFRYLTDLHSGRVSPSAVSFRLPLKPKSFDVARVVQEALAAGTLYGMPHAAAPQYPMYDRLRSALARYLELARDLSFTPLPVVRRVESGARYEGVHGLQRLLVVLGDLDRAAPEYDYYSDELVEAVKRFQDRHGLEPDGVIGRATFNALNIPLSHRVRQIELALERLRWIPPLDADRLIAINIPEFRLRAFAIEGGHAQLRLDLKVIVGRALDTQTPIFSEDMRYVEFSPYWNVPRSIALNELLPKLRKDPGYLRREEMELIGARAGVQATIAVNQRTLAALARGELRLRQRPGTRNQLGRIKFVLPNSMDVYLHDTPGVELFNLSKRDLSHGCIRVEQPVSLARFVLEDKPQWTDERMQGAMRADEPIIVHLSHPIPVVIFYTTVLTGVDGIIRFLPDIYGHDVTLDRALRAARASAGTINTK
jgi:murein L,D-transpeptidase YcbB/YkuD